MSERRPETPRWNIELRMAQTLDWISLERASPLLAVMPHSTRSTSRLVEHPKSARLFRRGDRPTAVYFVIAGEVRLVRQSQAGADIILQRSRSGFLAEASLDQNAYHCDAVVTTPSRILSIPRNAFLQALGDRDFQYGWMTHLARELRRVRAQTERLSLKTARDRIIHYIETEGEAGSVVLGQSKKDWAAELGLTHEALYRTLAQMERAGRIRIDGVAISILT